MHGNDSLTFLYNKCNYKCIVPQEVNENQIDTTIVRCEDYDNSQMIPAGLALIIGFQVCTEYCYAMSVNFKCL